MTEPTAQVGEEFRARPKSLLPPEVLRRLTRLSPARATLSLLQTWGLVGALIAVGVRWPHAWVWALCAIGLAGAQHGLAILAHQSAHYRLYETRWLNDLAGRLCAVPLGFSMLTYRIIHRTHHNHLYTAIDPDLAQVAGYPRGRRYLLRKLLKDLLGITTVKNYLYFLGRPRTVRPDTQGPAAPLDDTSEALRAAAQRDRRLTYALDLALVAGCLALGWGRWLLVLWVLPLVTVLQVLLRLRAVLEHGAVPDPRDPLRAARTTLAPAWVRWLVYPHSMNFHVEHHLYPAIPHYRLAEAHAELERAGVIAWAEVAPTLGQALARVFADPPTA